MSETTPAAEPRQLPSIPHEISAKIADHLDRPSSFALMLTCHALKVAGEIAAYKHLNLLGSWSTEIQMACRMLDAPAARARANIVAGKALCIHSTLRKYPHLIEYIDILTLEPSDGPRLYSLAQLLCELIGLVSHRLQRLDILPVPVKGQWTDDERSELGGRRFYNTLNRLNLPFPRLFHLKFGYQAASSAPAMDSWVQQMSNLQHLEYYSSQGSFFHLIPEPPIPSFQNLRTLVFDDLYEVPEEHGLQMLAILLELTPNLETLRLRGQWKPKKSQRVMKVLATMKKLKRIDTLDVDFQAYIVGVGIHFQKLGKVEIGIEEAVVDYGSFPEQEEGCFAGLPIPQAPLLGRLTIMNPVRPSPADYLTLPVNSTPQDPDGVHPYFITHLRRAPLLTTILYLHQPQFIPTAYNNSTDIPDFFVPPSRWTAEGHRGCVIRNYRESGSEEELWHTRSLLRAIENAMGETYVGTCRVWRDQAVYKGEVVPRDILDKVYGIMGERPDFVEGGRDLSFGPDGESAWNILRTWREPLGEDQTAILDTSRGDYDLLSDEE